MPKPTRPHRGDVEINAVVSAGELTFRDQPDTAVAFPGDGSRESASGSDRTNFPDRVDAGITYRNIVVDYRVASRLTDLGHSPRRNRG
ncbi:MAG: hypothetical protein ACRDPK_12495 [Carbonactinosporaceae bacterium]